MKDYVRHILGDLDGRPAQNTQAEVFMPSNIALVKYWGKRPGNLNLPLVSSLSYTLDGYGSKTHIALDEKDSLILNGKEKSGDEAKKTFAFLDLFRAPGEHYRVVSDNNIPTAAGVASSASGSAALTAAMIALKGWDVPLKEQSMLARLGSGSAARSFWNGIVLWHKGVREDGMDSYAEPLRLQTEPMAMAVLLLDQSQKKISSREAMKISLATSPLAAEWPARQQAHLDAALKVTDLPSLGYIAEENAELMHELIRTGAPAIDFDLPGTKEWKARVRQWRGQGVPVWYTQDAGPNLKLLFPQTSQKDITERLSVTGVGYFIV